MSRRTCLVLYKQMQPNPIISFWSQSFKTVDFSQLVCSDVFFTQTQWDFSIQISHHKNHNATWVRIASFWKEAVLCLYYRCYHKVVNLTSLIFSGAANIPKIQWNGIPRNGNIKFNTQCYFKYGWIKFQENFCKKIPILKQNMNLKMPILVDCHWVGRNAWLYY